MLLRQTTVCFFDVSCKFSRSVRVLIYIQIYYTLYSVCFCHIFFFLENNVTRVQGIVPVDAKVNPSVI